MKDQYAGDIGDYFKLSLLRALSRKRSLGVAWYRTADDKGGDGQFTTYLGPKQEPRWRDCDPELYDALRALFAVKGRPAIADLTGMLPAPTRFHDTELAGRTDRTDWFAGVMEQLSSQDLIFADPDNGIAAPSSAAPAPSIKSATLAELAQLGADGRELLVYHHQTRRSGGHLGEMEYLAEKLAALGTGNVCAARFAPGSARVFFLVYRQEETHEIVRNVADRWAARLGRGKSSTGLAPVEFRDFGTGPKSRADRGDGMRLLVTINLAQADLALFEAYESRVLSLLAAHGGELEFRLRAVDGQSETHLLRFPDGAAFEAYRADPRRQALQDEWERSGARATITPVEGA